MSLQTLQQAATDAFERQFGAKPLAMFRAPGRVNLIGEHTDYNDGFVLPCAIDYQTVIVASPRNDTQVKMVAVDFDGQTASFDLSQPHEFDQTAFWSNYVRGVAQSLQKRGFTLSGCDLAIAGNVPLGAGLSSSAALEVALGSMFNQFNELNLDGETIALVGQQAENEFVGCNCGIMDQLISAKGQQDHALLIDCRSLQTVAVPMPQDLSVVIVNSNVKRGLVDSEYNTRRAQCEAAAEHFGVRALRDLNMDEFEQGLDGLDRVALKRARHVISENQRTLDAADALADGDLIRLGELMAASHASMRDDFEITVPPIDNLVEIIKNVIGYQGGVRMTGGGFGGCVVALVHNSEVDAVCAAVRNYYPQQSGLEPTIYICHASDGAVV